MADDTSAALIAQLDVKFDALATNMKKAMAVFDNGGRALEKRQAQIRKNLSNWAIDFTGLGGINKAIAGLTAVAIVGGLADLVKKSLDAASAIGDIAQQAGVSTDFLQKLRFAGSQAGASFDIVDNALTTLNKNFGDFVFTGGGRDSATFKKFGIKDLISSGDIRNTEQLFDVITKKVGTFGSEAQKSALLAGAFGKEAGPKLLQLMNEGAAGISRLEAQAVSLGVVLSGETIRGAKEANDKLDALFSVIKTEGIAAVANLAPEIAQLAQEITDGLPSLVRWVEEWAAFFGLIQLSPTQKLQNQIAGLNDELNTLLKNRGEKTGLGGFLNSLGTAGLDQEIAKKRAQIADAQATLASTKPGIKPYVLTPNSNTEAFGQPKLTVAQTPAEIAAAKAAEELRQRQAAALAQSILDAKTADAAMIAAQDQTNVQLLKGSAEYYNAVKQQINDEYQVKVNTAEAEAQKQIDALNKQGTNWKGYAEAVGNVNDVLTSKIVEAGEERKRALDESGLSSSIRDAITQGQQQVQQYQDEASAIGLTVGELAREAFYQSLINEAKQKGITLTREQIAQTPDLAKVGDAIAAAAKATDDANRKYQDSVTLTDQLRSGLSEVGLAGLHGFNDIGDAIASAALQLGEMIFQLKVMQPLLNGLLGQQGTAGGGLLGGLLNPVLNLFGAGDLATNVAASIAANPLLFDDGGYTGSGGKNEPAGIVHKGEYVFDQAAVRRIGVPALRAMQKGYANGGYVGMPSLPSIPQVTARASPPPIYLDLRGAVVTQDLLNEVNRISEGHAKNYSRQAATFAISESNRQFPTNLSTNLRDRG